MAITHVLNKSAGNKWSAVANVSQTSLYYVNKGTASSIGYAYGPASTTTYIRALVKDSGVVKWGLVYGTIYRGSALYYAGGNSNYAYSWISRPSLWISSSGGQTIGSVSAPPIIDRYTKMSPGCSLNSSYLIYQRFVLTTSTRPYTQTVYTSSGSYSTQSAGSAPFIGSNLVQACGIKYGSTWRGYTMAVGTASNNTGKGFWSGGVWTWISGGSYSDASIPAPTCPSNRSNVALSQSREEWVASTHYFLSRMTNTGVAGAGTEISGPGGYAAQATENAFFVRNNWWTRLVTPSAVGYTVSSVIYSDHTTGACSINGKVCIQADSYAQIITDGATSIGLVTTPFRSRGVSGTGKQNVLESAGMRGISACGASVTGSAYFDTVFTYPIDIIDENGQQATGSGSSIISPMFGQSSVFVNG